jgi:hypothetical protein
MHTDKCGLCSHIGKLCPAPPCILSSPPHVCEYYNCDDGNCNWSTTESVCGGNSDCIASDEWYKDNGQEYYEDEGDSELEEAEEGGGSDYDQEQEQYGGYYAYDTETYEAAVEQDTSDRDYVDGVGSDSLNDQSATADVNYAPFIIVAGLVGGFIMVLVVLGRRVGKGAIRYILLFFNLLTFWHPSFAG